MPQLVELPNGTELEFPDGMDQAAMDAEIRKAFPGLGGGGQATAGVTTPDATIGDFMEQVPGESTVSSPVSGGVPELATEGALLPSREADAELMGELARQGVRQEPSARESQITLPKPKDQTTVVGGALTRLAEIGEGVLNNPAYVVGAASPPIAVAEAVHFTIEGAKQVVEDVKQAVKGDRGAIGKAVVGAAATALPVVGAKRLMKEGVGARDVAAESIAQRGAPATAEAVKGAKEVLEGEAVQATVKESGPIRQEAVATTQPVTEGAATTAPPLGIVPEAARKLAERVHGEELIDQQRIKTAIAEKDVLPGRDFIASPEFEFRKNPKAKELVTMGVEANLEFKSRTAHTAQRLEALKGTLSKADQEGMTRALFAREAGAADAMAKLPPEAQAAAGEIRAVYDDVKARIVADKEQSIANELSGPQLNALRQVQDGAPLAEAAKANGLQEGGRAIVQSALEEIGELSKWGVENYTTHIERGSYRVVNPEGVTVAIGETRAAAAIKADKWLKANPEVKTVTIDDQFSPGVEFPTQLSRGQYFRMIQRLHESLGESAREIQELLHKQGSIVAVKPTDKYAGPMQQRRGVLKGEEDVFDVLPTYVHIMEKKLALDPVMRKARLTLPELPGETRAQVEAWLKDLKGQKTVGDRTVDYVLDRFGGKPFAYSRGLETLRSISTQLKLGYRPVAAAVNRVAGLQHTWIKTGAEPVLEGRKWLKTEEGKVVLERNKSRLGIEAAFIHETLRATGEKPLWHPLGMFQAAERANRPEAFAAHYQVATKQLGMAGEQAEAYARGATRFGQFVYDVASLPRIMREPTGRFVFQFKPYLVKELEFISSLKGAEIPRYLASFLLVGGPRAAIYTLKSLPYLGAVGALSQLEDWMNREMPAASRGVGGAIGVDVSPSVAFQFPTTISELFGPVVSDLTRLWNDVVGPAVRGEDRDWSDMGKWGRRLAPAMHYWSQLVEAAASESGWVTDARGRPEYKPSKSDYVKLAMGAKPLEKSVQEVEARFLRDQEAIARKNRARLIDKFLDATDKEDGAAVGELLEAMVEAGVTVEAVKAAGKGRKLEPKLRLLRSLSKATRARERGRFEGEGE